MFTIFEDYINLPEENSNIACSVYNGCIKRNIPPPPNWWKLNITYELKQDLRAGSTTIDEIVSNIDYYRKNNIRVWFERTTKYV